MADTRMKRTFTVRSGDRAAGGLGKLPQAGAAARHQESGHVRRRDRQRADDFDLGARSCSRRRRDLNRCGSPLNVSFWLWFTVVFANFAEAVAEGRGKAQAATLRKMRKETTARRLVERTARRSGSRLDPAQRRHRRRRSRRTDSR